VAILYVFMAGSVGGSGCANCCGSNVGSRPAPGPGL